MLNLCLCNKQTVARYIWADRDGTDDEIRSVWLTITNVGELSEGLAVGICKCQGLGEESVSQFYRHIIFIMELEPHWFALSVYRNKVFEARDYFKSAGYITYLPIVQTLDAQHRTVECPAVSRLLFVKTTIESIISEERLSLSASDHCPRFYIYRCADRQTPQIIPEPQMQMFILVSSAGESDLVYYSLNGAQNYKQGDHVRVIDGIFKDAEGYVRRVKDDRRVVVEIEGICAVALPFIHYRFLQKI